ncbi:MAG TPA: ABC transporter substrate-binding protein, partial [Candidatus Polarisedimenticolia bacterium]|nr:ABC transporter substrate-binding protein [Candidatus Polarisedimenticolia bacterium]
MTGPPARIRAAPVLIALLQAIAVTGCGRRLDPATTLTVAVDSGPVSLDPRLGSDEASRRLFDLLYSGLFRVDDDARPVADLASSYRIEDSRTVVVTLRPDVLFHDGSRCTARDVLYTYDSILADEVPSFRKGDLSMLDSIEAPDDHTVVFRLKQPFAPILTELNVPILKAGAGLGAGTDPVGTGPFRLIRYRKDEDLLLARFDGYFLGPSGVGTIHLKIIPSETARLLELLKGSVDLIVNDLSPDQFARVARTRGFRVQERPGRNTVYMAFNLTDPILSDRRVRQAIALALDRGALVAHLLHGAATLATGLLPPGHWAYTPDVPRYDFDPAAAADLLERAGYRDPDGSGPRPRFSLTCKISTSELAQELAAVIQDQLGRIGIGIAIRAYEWPTFYEDLKAGRFQIAVSNWTEISDPDIYRLRFHSRHVPPRGFNRGRYGNAEVDRLIDAGAATLDEGERSRIYGDLQRILARDLPCVNLWHRAVAAARRDRVRGFRLTSGADFYPLREITLGPTGGERGG